MKPEIKERIKKTRRGEIPEGHKKTKKVIIPNDWHLKKLKELSSMKSGEGITSQDISELGSYPCFGGNGFRGFTENFTHNGEFALIGRQGALCGNVQYVKGAFFASEHAVVVTANLGTDIKWLSYLLKYMSLNKHSESSAQPGLSVKKLLELEAVFPPQKKEQQKIATILSTWDRAIELKEQLIEQKKQLRRGLMQNLLTGKVRLPGFKGEWKEKKLSEIVKKYKGSTLRYNNKGKYPAIDMEFFETGKFKNSTKDCDVIASKEDVLMLWDGSNAGKAFTLVEGAVGSTFVKFECISIDNIFLQMFLEYNEKKIMRMREGSGVPHIPKDFLNYFKVKLPSLKEQKAISNIILTINKTIGLLEQELELLKQQKKGLMQLLLTGIVRVPEAYDQPVEREEGEVNA